MPDADRDLTEVLQELHELLESAHDLGEPEREALRDAASEIDAALDDDAGLGAPLEALRTRIERFETEHPRLTEAVRRLIDQLADMGI